MPHKRAKRSVREQRRSQTADINLASVSRSTIVNEPIPKGAARILNAAKVQKEWAEKKRKLDEDEQGPAQKKRKQGAAEGGESHNTALKIQSGESIAHFNRRVEDSMRSSVRVAIKSSSAIARRARKEEESKKSGQSKVASNAAAARSKRSTKSPEAEEEVITKSAKGKDIARQDRATDFQSLSTSVPRRLNDIVQAPPELKKLPRGATKDKAQKHGEGKTLKQGILSMAQKAMLEEERERAVRLYREMKKQKISGE
ncbi:hypothetical protein OBBRIDRAFT_316245 [Obba rivulosa]|uniref:Uncharacterized protein n=1 Tax=Obba rivulosa TaxID=1052685 RepID=A0A8E2DPH5_9APHY|nr:hypothetical protein OBBRIDRAFT_316245 [Obba rivulosa]